MILQRIGVDPTAVPKDNTSYAVGDSIGGGIVVALALPGTKMSMSILILLASLHIIIQSFLINGMATTLKTYNYKTDTILTANATTLNEAVLTSVILPKFIEGIGGKSNSNRIPFAYRVRLTGLTPNTTYRFANQIVLSTDFRFCRRAGQLYIRFGNWRFYSRIVSGFLNQRGHMEY